MSFAVRTVKDGRVRINGITYRVREQHMAYDGRMDGHRFAFGLYRGRDDFVSLWGTEAMYRAVGEEYEREWDKGGPHVVENAYPWEWWDAQGR